MSLTLRRLLGQNVIEMGLGALETALARLSEALGRAPIGFHLRHVLLTFKPCHVPIDYGRCRRVEPLRLSHPKAVTHFSVGLFSLA